VPGGSRPSGTGGSEDGFGEEVKAAQANAQADTRVYLGMAANASRHDIFVYRSGGPMRRTCLLCGVLLLACISSLAQNAPGPQKPPVKSQPASTAAGEEKKISPAKEADIRKLLALLGTTATMEQTMQSMEKSIRPMMASSLPPGDYQERLLTLFFEKFHSKMDVQKLTELAIPLYDKYYTDEDIKGLMQFYQTPLGRKTVKVLPNLMGELTEAGQSMGQDMARQSMMEVIAEHPEIEKAMEDAQAQK
jgi:uncharacterized protein